MFSKTPYWNNPHSLKESMSTKCFQRHHIETIPTLLRRVLLQNVFKETILLIEQLPPPQSSHVPAPFWRVVWKCFFFFVLSEKNVQWWQVYVFKEKTLSTLHILTLC